MSSWLSLLARSLRHSIEDSILSRMNASAVFGAFVMTVALPANAGVIVGHQGAPTGGDPALIQPIWMAQTESAPTTPNGVQVLRDIPFALIEGPQGHDHEHGTHPKVDHQNVYEELLLSDEVAARISQKLAPLNRISPQIAGSELRTIIEQGPAQNRICLTFLGDGYTEAEKDRFFEDVSRLTQDLFTGSTFASYLPLFNVYAVFVPSSDSGITDGSIRKDTAFGLYRTPAGSKRAIMPGNTSALESALRLAPKTDYPIVIANDDYYGGLGGRYAITTRSPQSGAIVLRHELGHNFGNVGEEYDGGQVYSGANSSQSANNPSWKHWIEGTPRSFEMKMLDGQYLWKNLSTGPVRSQFNFPTPNSKGAYWFDAHISSVGWETPEDVMVLLDGQRVEIEGTYTDDRSFFKVVLNRSLSPGAHTLEIRNGKVDNDNVLAFANLYAYEGDYAFDGTYGSFMTYDTSGSLSYRPTHEQCLMRDMTTPHFCSVDKENMWVRFLDRVRLVDDLKIFSDPAGSAKQVKLLTAKLPGLQVRWSVRASPTSAEKLLPEYNDLKEFTLPSDLGGRELIARVSFVTPEVRKPTARFNDQRTLSF